MNYYDLIIISKQESFFINKKLVSIIIDNIIYNNFIILKIEYCGLREFMYKIKNHNKGYYIMMSFSGNYCLTNQICNYLKNNVNVLRFLILKLRKKNKFLSFFILNKIFKTRWLKKKVK